MFVKVLLNSKKMKSGIFLVQRAILDPAGERLWLNNNKKKKPIPSQEMRAPAWGSHTNDGVTHYNVCLWSQACSSADPGCTVNARRPTVGQQVWLGLSF